MKIVKCVLSVFVTLIAASFANAKITAVEKISDTTESFQQLAVAGSSSDRRTYSLPVSVRIGDIEILIQTLDIKDLTQLKRLSTSTEGRAGDSRSEQTNSRNYDSDNLVSSEKIYLGSNSSLPGSYQYFIAHAQNIQLDDTPVPEAETWAMALSAIALVVFQLRRKQLTIQSPQLAL